MDECKPLPTLVLARNSRVTNTFWSTPSGRPEFDLSGRTKYRPSASSFTSGRNLKLTANLEYSISVYCTLVLGTDTGHFQHGCSAVLRFRIRI